MILYDLVLICRLIDTIVIYIYIYIGVVQLIHPSYRPTWHVLKTTSTPIGMVLASPKMAERKATRISTAWRRLSWILRASGARWIRGDAFCVRMPSAPYARGGLKLLRCRTRARATAFARAFLDGACRNGRKRGIQLLKLCWNASLASLPSSTWW